MRSLPFCPTAGKTRFASFTDADRQLRHATFPHNRRRGEAPMKIVPYRCRACNGWHVGHSVLPRKQGGYRG